MLIITEKPSVARKISSFLSNNRYKTIRFSKNIYYYHLNLEGKNIYVVPAIGHLFTLSDLDKKYDYPTFNYKWVPSYFEDGIIAKKYYIEMFRKFRNENDIIIATDYDIEGELIGYNILRYILNKENASRMIFSAITYKDIVRAFNNRKESLNFGYIFAGETRHIIDWLYGINLSRALTRSLLYYTRKFVLSIGRVQGPTLMLIFNRENEIKNFKPEEYYKVEALVIKDDKKLKFSYIKDKINDKDEANKIKNSLGEYLIVSNVDKKEEKINSPHPYNLTDIQMDAYKYYKISPKRTLDILQSLYEKGYISYPRTSSQKLPETINFREILSNLSLINSYKKYIILLLEKQILKPNNGSKDDVHPAIHPTGNIPEYLEYKEKLIYDLIVRRFIATFYDPAIVYKINVITKENFIYNYYDIKYKGWLDIYWNIYKDNFASLKFNIGERLLIDKVNILKRKTKPPARYNKASLIKKMEELNLGTKSTRADIVEILFKRRYVEGKSIKITELGKKIVEIFERYYPDILNINFTRKMEENLEKLENKPDISLKERIIKENVEIIKDLSKVMKENERKIGEELYNFIKYYLNKKKIKK
ncbi:MAG: DNA topoisomerase I [Candidatus Nanopusillus sp.]